LEQLQISNRKGGTIVKHLTEVLAISLLACTVAVAQGAPSGTPSDRGSSPRQGTDSTNQGNGSNQDGSTPSTSTESATAGASQEASGNNEAKGGKKLKGCIRSENGKYVLETKHDKTILLTGSDDFGPHVGHTVTLHGNFMEDRNTGAMSEHSGMNKGDSSGMGADQGKTSPGSPSTASSFQVTKMEMVSDSCSLGAQNGAKKQEEKPPSH
jgi:hypothetical protein